MTTREARQAEMRSLTEGLGAEWFDATKIKTYQTCPRKFFYRHEMNLVPKGDMATALSFGIAIHSALESFYHGTWAEKVPCPAHESRPLSDCMYCDGNGDSRRFIADFLSGFPAEAEAGARTRKTGVELLLKYAQQWKDDAMLDSILGVEQPFAVPLRGLAEPAYWIGRMDLIIGSKDVSGKPIVTPWDHKTASRFGEAFEGGFKIDVQITGYMVAIGELYHEPCTQAIINALRVTTKISHESFLRKVTTRLPHEFEEWYMTVGKAIEQIRLARQTGDWEQRDSGCFAYNHPCEYRAICLTAPRAREGIIAAAYNIEKWEPV